MLIFVNENICSISAKNGIGAIKVISEQNDDCSIFRGLSFSSEGDPKYRGSYFFGKKNKGEGGHKLIMTKCRESQDDYR